MGSQCAKANELMLWHPQPYDCNCWSFIALPLITTAKKISQCSLSETEASSQPVDHFSSNLNKQWFPQVGRKWGQQSSSSSTKSDPFNHYDSLCKHTSEWSVVRGCDAAGVRLRIFFFCDYHQCSRNECRERRGDSDKTSDRLCQDLDCVACVIIKGRWFFFLLFFSKIISLAFPQPEDNRNIILTAEAIRTSGRHTNSGVCKQKLHN